MVAQLRDAEARLWAEIVGRANRRPGELFRARKNLEFREEKAGRLRSTDGRLEG